MKNKDTFIIAEIGQAHEGSLGIAHSYIDALASTGVNAVKFQTHIAKAESSLEEPFRVKFSYEDKTRFEYWQRMEFTFEQWLGLKEHCEEKGMVFISSPFSLAAVDLLNQLKVEYFKIGSGEVNNLLLLEKIAKTGRSIILSSGMSSYQELDDTVQFIKSFGNPLSILQCTTAYPTNAEQWGLNVISELRDRFEVPIGFSDHSGDIYACLAAATVGAELLEFHVVFDKRMFGPDAKASLTIDEVRKLVTGVRQIDTALKSPIDKRDNSPYLGLKKIFEKSLAVNKHKPKGSILEIDDLETKKPSNMGIPASKFREVLGKPLMKDKTKWSFLTPEDFES